MYRLNEFIVRFFYRFTDILQINSMSINNKNSAEVDIAPAFSEITTACNVGQAKKGHGGCLKSGQLVDVNFLDLTENFDKVSGA